MRNETTTESAKRQVKVMVLRATLAPLGMLLSATILLFLMQSRAAHAEGTVGDLSTIQSETILLKAKVGKASAQAELDRSSGAASAAGGDEPVVRSVYGVGGQLVASFLYANGVSVERRVGDTLPGGFKVVTITIENVELSKGGKVFPVGFSATPPVQGSPGMALPSVVH